MHAAIQSMSRTTVIKWFFNIIIPLFLLLVPTTELFTMQIKLFLLQLCSQSVRLHLKP